MRAVSRKGTRLVDWGWFLAFLIAMAFAPKVFAETIAVTQPKLVTVFPDGARVTREGTLVMEAGVQKVIFPDLPASVIESSLRLNVEGPHGTKLYGVGLRKEYTPDVVQERTRLLKDHIQELQDQKTDLNDRIEARKSEIDILKGLSKENTNIATTHPGTIVDFTHSAGAVGARIAKLLAASRLDERSARDLDSQITALNSELAQGGTAAREKRTAEADLELAEAGTARFTLTYQVSQASWAPLYDLRLETEGETPRLSLAFNAGVRQKTGEDWKNVSLILSTARPTQGTQVPDPTNWWLDFFNNEMRKAKRVMGFAANAPAMEALASRDDKDEEKEPMEQAEVVTAETVRSEYTMTYAIPVKRDIPSDGSDHRVSIAEDYHPAQITLVAVPRLSPAAYLETRITYGGEQTLLPGQAQLFRDGDFVGTTHLGAKAPGESFELGFGQDDQVRVERKMVGQTTGKSGFIFTKGERKYHWVTTVANYHLGARTVEIREQMPRSREKQITVEATEILPKALAENPEKPGLLRWQVKLGPKEKAKITFAYKVNFPENMQVTGLE